MEGVNSKYISSYTTRELPYGVLIERPGSPPLQITFGPTYFLAKVGEVEKEFGLFSYAALTDWAADQWIQSWQQPPDKRNGRRWVKKSMARAISKHFHAHWQRLLRLADPQVVAVHRAIFAATFRDAPIAFYEGLYQERYIRHYPK